MTKRKLAEFFFREGCYVKKKRIFIGSRGKPMKKRKVSIVIWGYRRNKRGEKKGEGTLEPRRRR